MSKEKRKYAKWNFPRYSLEDTLRVAEAIQDKYNGNPTSPFNLAKALDMTTTSSSFRYITGSSLQYGLTKGGYKAKQISLTDLGKSIVKPRSEKERLISIRKAAHVPETLRKVYEYYGGGKYPDHNEFFRNLLERDFKINVKLVNKFMDILKANGIYAHILKEQKGNLYVVYDDTELSDVELDEDADVLLEDIDYDEGLDEENAEKYIDEKEEIEKLIPRVFISHSKNKKIVDQIKEILEFGQFEFRIAEERETTAIPIPDKVFGMMRECNSAIINVSADEQEKREDNSYGINQNVLIEIGAAFLLYNKKVILLVDKRIDLPSNLQGLYRSEYEGDELSFNTAMKLQRTLTEFRKP